MKVRWLVKCVHIQPFRWHTSKWIENELLYRFSRGLVLFTINLLRLVLLLLDMSWFGCISNVLFLAFICWRGSLYATSKPIRAAALFPTSKRQRRTTCIH